MYPYAQMHLACLALYKGEEAEAVQVLVQHLQGWLDIGRSTCVGCGQKRGEDAPMLSCDGCRVARFCMYASLCVCLCLYACMHTYMCRCWLSYMLAC